MAHIINGSDEDVSVRAYGKDLFFKSGQIKQVNEGMAQFLMSNAAYLGFAPLSEKFEDLEYAKSAEAEREIAEAKAKGVSARIAHLKGVVNNLKSSVRQDMRQANIDADPAIYATDGELLAMELLVKYQLKGKDEVQARVDRVKELEEQLKAAQ